MGSLSLLPTASFSAFPLCVSRFFPIDLLFAFVRLSVVYTQHTQNKSHVESVANITKLSISRKERKKRRVGKKSFSEFFVRSSFFLAFSSSRVHFRPTTTTLPNSICVCVWFGWRLVYLGWCSSLFCCFHHCERGRRGRNSFRCNNGNFFS